MLSFDDVEKLPTTEQYRFWIQWMLDNCDDSPEWNYGEGATNRIKKLLKES